MNFFIMVSLFLSAALGVFRGIDLALLTDAETGLCIVGSVWLRYGALAVAVGAAVAAGRCCKPQTDALRGHLHAFRRRGTGGGCLLWRGCCAAHPLDGEQRGNAYPGCAGGAVRVLDDRSRPELAAEGLEDPHPQPDARRAGQRRVLLVRAGPLYGEQLQLAPGGPTAMVWQLLAGLVFLSALARALYLPGTSDGRTLCAGGLAAFALCLCWELPTVLQTPCTGGRRGSADADAAVPAGAVLCGRFGSLERCALHKD